MKTVFLRALEAEDKAAVLLTAIREPETARGKQRFEVDTAGFAAVGTSPFAYWVSDGIRGIFSRLPGVEADGRLARRTNSVDDNFRFVRLWWETQFINQNASCRWYPWAKGGSFSPFYYGIDTVIAWNASRFTYPGFVGTPSRPLERPASADLFFRPGITWPLRTNGLSFRELPAHSIFGAKGSAVCIPGDDTPSLFALLAILNSRPFTFLVSIQLARTELAQSYEVGLIQQTPIPQLTEADKAALVMLSRRAWSLQRGLDTRIETSRAFTLPALMKVDGTTFDERAKVWAEHRVSVISDLATIQTQIDDRCFDLYGIDEADRRAITEGFRSLDSKEAPVDDASDAEDEADENEALTHSTSLAAELVFWAVGVAFGRFDVRLATAARPMPAESEPFDPLPVCSPGMLTGRDGLPLAQPPPGYPLVIPESGVLVDDPGHAHDLQTAVRSVFDVVFGAGADRWWNDVAALLEPRSNDLRVWLARSFFEYHLKRYSKSRRKAPILWQLGIPSGRYSVWLYAHRLTRDSFFQIQNDVVAPKLAHEERQLTSLVKSAGASPSSKDRKEIATQTAFVDELRALLDEVKRVTPLWNPTFDDGVVLVMAPLWRLVPQHKAWQRELKSKWDELVSANYDWAQIAMYFWPERVVPRCSTDRSVAIAHRLEDVFWTEGADGKWKRRSTPTNPMDELVRERTSSAVKRALISLLEAPIGARGPRRATLPS